MNLDNYSDNLTLPFAQIEDPTGSFFVFPFFIGPAAIMGLSSAVAGVASWVWADVSYGMFSLVEHKTANEFLDSVQIRL